MKNINVRFILLHKNILDGKYFKNRYIVIINQV